MLASTQTRARMRTNGFSHLNHRCRPSLPNHLCLTVGCFLEAETSSLASMKRLDPGAGATDTGCGRVEADRLARRQRLHPRRAHPRTRAMEAESFAAEEGTEAGNEGVGTADMEDTIMVTVTATATATATVMKVNITTSVDAVHADQVRRSLALFRQNLGQRAEVLAAVRQFKSEIRQNKRQHHSISRNIRSTGREHGRELKGQRKAMKAELKLLVKEARAVRKADRKARKAERKLGRAQRKAERRGMDAEAMSQKWVAKAERKAQKAQRKAVEVSEMAREKAMEAERCHRPEAYAHEGERQVAEKTRSLGLSDTKRQESGVCDPEA
ncbi:MAG: hypothetical protein LQ338_001089 [Usnochroma carphineum]|nr:MAG: hypothetical protein LQ338_001089 [Usnochroma carphineum]